MYHYVIDQNQDSMTSNNSIVGQNLALHCKTKHFFFSNEDSRAKRFFCSTFYILPLVSSKILLEIYVCNIITSKF